MSTPRTSAPSNYDGGNRGCTLAARARDNSIEQRIGSVIAPQPNGCWLYQGRPDRYGRVLVAGALIPVHRYVYELLNDTELAPNVHLHHTCQTPGCCNPAHLTPLTPAEHAAEHKRIRQEAQDDVPVA